MPPKTAELTPEEAAAVLENAALLERFGFGLEDFGGGTVLLECLCNLTANEMFDSEGNERDPYDKILREVRDLASRADNLILVTNDVGSDAEAYSESTLRYVDTLGRLNAAFAAEFDAVYELVCGIPLPVKGALLP